MAIDCFNIWDIGGCGCCLVTFTVECAGAVVVGATVTVKDGATTIASGVTDSAGQVTLDTESAGTYTVTASGSTCTSLFSGSLSLTCGGSQTLQCCAGACSVAVYLTDCSGGAGTATATAVGVTTGGSYSCTIASGTCTMTGLTYDPSGYTVTMNYGGQSATGNAACNGTITFTYQQYTIEGCGSFPLPGATVEVVCGGTSVTETTNSAGRAWVLVGPGTCSVTVTATRFATYTGTAGCGTIALAPASGYLCCSDCASPICSTLNCTDSVTGSLTLTYGATTPLGASPTTWNGTLTYNYGGACGCPAASVQIVYFYGCGTLSVQLLGSQALPNSGSPSIPCPCVSSTAGLCPGAGTTSSLTISPAPSSLACGPLDAVFSATPGCDCSDCTVFSFGNCGCGFGAAFGTVWGGSTTAVTFTVTDTC